MTTAALSAAHVQHAARRRAAHPTAAAAPLAAAPAASTQVLPLTVRAGVHVSNGLLYPVLGAVLGTFLLGPIGAVVGGVAGWMLTH